jgi:DNA (cytosine-5)-methyltransferase 1
MLAFENVVGLLSRNSGRDMISVLRAMSDLGYRVGALEIDAARFLPQSRPRLFVVAVREDVSIAEISERGPSGIFHTNRIQRLYGSLPARLRRNWVWWRHSPPEDRTMTFSNLVDHDPDNRWLSELEVDKLLSMMSLPSEQRVQLARTSGTLEIGLLYKRGRPDADGRVRQRAEIRFDGLAGCLRTPRGGSSRQTVVFVQGNQTRARLLSIREAARLMGLNETYKMPKRYNHAYQVAGDGVAVPIVKYLDDQIFQNLQASDAQRNVA